MCYNNIRSVLILSRSIFTFSRDFMFDENERLMSADRELSDAGENKLRPRRGVYITECEIGEDVYPSITNVGTRPTTDGDDSYENMETHIIGYDGDLYYSFIKVNFYKFLRDERKFSSLDELISQISRDTKEAKDYFLK